METFSLSHTFRDRSIIHAATIVDNHEKTMKRLSSSERRPLLRFEGFIEAAVVLAHQQQRLGLRLSFDGGDEVHILFAIEHMLGHRNCQRRALRQAQRPCSCCGQQIGMWDHAVYQAVAFSGGGVDGVAEEQQFKRAAHAHDAWQEIGSPISAPVRPTFVKRKAKRAFSEAMRRSEASAMTAPAPAVMPLRAAMIGLSSRRIFCTTAPVMRVNSRCSFTSRLSSSPMIWCTSPPEQKLSPAPVSTIARTVSSLRSAANRSRNWA